MKSFLILFSLILTILTPSVSFAKFKISLVTVSPDSTLFFAFGHTALLLEDTKKPEKLAYFEYGYVGESAIFSNSDPITSLLEMFNNKIPTQSVKHPLQSVRENDGTGKSVIKILGWETILQNYLNRPTHNEITINELNLTKSQLKFVLAKLAADHKGNTYYYHNFEANCTTKLRDILLDEKIIGKKVAEMLKDEKNNPALGDDGKPASLQELSYAAMDYAASRSLNHSIYLVDRRFARKKEFKQTIALLKMLGIPGQFDTDSNSTASKKFNDSIVTLRDTIRASYKDTDFDKAFTNYFFDPKLLTKPISEWDGLFLPIRLHNALLRLGLISAKNQILHESNAPKP